MNRKMKNAVTSLVAVVFLLGVLACNSVGDLFKSGGDNTSTSNVGKTKISDTNSEDSTKKGLAQEIVGTWELTDEGRKVKFIFTSGGEITIDEGEGSKKADYKVIDEETIEVQPPGQKPVKTKVKVNGDSMTIDDRGKTISLKKVS